MLVRSWVEMMLAKFQKLTPVKVTEKFNIEKYSHVMHIVSNVVGDL